MTIPDQYTVIMEYEEPFFSFVDAGNPQWLGLPCA